jgi:hypothetical protein
VRCQTHEIFSDFYKGTKRFDYQQQPNFSANHIPAISTKVQVDVITTCKSFKYVFSKDAITNPCNFAGDYFYKGAKGSAPVLSSMKWTEESGFVLVDGELTTTADTVAWANFTNAVNETGWSYLEVRTDHRFPDKVQVGELSPSRQI